MLYVVKFDFLHASVDVKVAEKSRKFTKQNELEKRTKTIPVSVFPLSRRTTVPRNGF